MGARFRGGTFESRSPGWVYTIHFDRPFGHAKHYTGFTKNLNKRMAEHKAGSGSRLMAHVAAAGIGWQVASVEWSDHGKGREGREGQLKWRGASRRCGICKYEAKLDEEAHTDLFGNRFTDAEIQRAEEMSQHKLDEWAAGEHPAAETARDENALAVAGMSGFGHPNRADYALMDPHGAWVSETSVAGKPGVSLPAGCTYDGAEAE